MVHAGGDAVFEGSVGACGDRLFGVDGAAGAAKMVVRNVHRDRRRGDGRRGDARGKVPNIGEQ